LATVEYIMNRTLHVGCLKVMLRLEMVTVQIHLLCYLHTSKYHPCMMKNILMWWILILINVNSPYCSCWLGETVSLNCGHKRACCCSSSRLYIWVWRTTVEWWWRENRGTLRKICPSATLSNKICTWTEPGVDPDLCGGRPATKCLSHGTTKTACYWLC
jgi:hypothetical protein